MRISKLFTKTRREVPADEVARNSQLLIRAGFLHKEMAGVYAFLPLGLRVLENVKQIIRQEMNALGGQEVAMTVLQPKELFEKTDRWDDKKVDNWFKTKLVNGSELGMGLTHEEPIVDMLADNISSYKDLPVLVYQIQTKFRNEMRAQAGLLRGREFMMKDMYSFARNQREHEEIYERTADAYNRIFEQLGIGNITYRTYADGGIFTSRFSDEFQMISKIGEDTIFVDKERNIAINQEVINDNRLSDKNIDISKLEKHKAIEVGNIFSLESKYTDALGVYYTDEDGSQQKIIAGCYGIGVSRLVGALAEHFADDKGLIWPENIAPAKIYLISVGNISSVISQADLLYNRLTNSGIQVLYDDRQQRPGEKFADADLMGIPFRIVVSERTIQSGKYELKKRTDKESIYLDIDEILTTLS